MKWIGYLGGLMLAGILLFAAYAKAIDPQAFAEQIRAEGLGFGLPPFAMAVAAIALEAGLGLALLLNLRHRSVMIIATALVLGFIALTGRTYWRSSHGLLSAEEEARCGCFGNLVERTPGEAFWQDLALLLPALALAWTGRPPAESARSPRRLLVAGLGTIAAAGFAAAAPGLPLDNLATNAAPGVKIADICAGKDKDRICLDFLVPELRTGSHWVILVDVHAADFADTVGALNRYVASGRNPGLAVLADLTQEEQMGIFWRLAPAFELHETPLVLLRPLYRKLPRSLLIEEGRVIRTAAGLPAEFADAVPNAAVNASVNPTHSTTDDPKP
ncbi:MAG: MauE/DoxX family redox-associated membrane protein [Thermoanaerobaculia bacterium]